MEKGSHGDTASKGTKNAMDYLKWGNHYFKWFELFLNRCLESRSVQIARARFQKEDK